jgi:hypothetical protein
MGLVHLALSAFRCEFPLFWDSRLKLASDRARGFLQREGGAPFKRGPAHDTATAECTGGDLLFQIGSTPWPSRG